MLKHMQLSQIERRSKQFIFIRPNQQAIMLHSTCLFANLPHYTPCRCTLTGKNVGTPLNTHPV